MPLAEIPLTSAQANSSSSLAANQFASSQLCNSLKLWMARLMRKWLWLYRCFQCSLTERNSKNLTVIASKNAETSGFSANHTAVSKSKTGAFETWLLLYGVGKAHWMKLCLLSKSSSLIESSSFLRKPSARGALAS